MRYSSFVLGGFFVVLMSGGMLAEDRVPGQLIVGTKPRSGFSVATTHDHFHNAMGALSVKAIGTTSLERFGVQSVSLATTAYLLSFAEDRDLELVKRRYEEEDWVAYVEPHYTVQLIKPVDQQNAFRTQSRISSAHDPYFTYQDYLSETGLDQLAALPTREDIVVAVVDTGVDIGHEDLRYQLFVNTAEQPNGIDDDGNGLIDDIHGYNFIGHHQGGGDTNLDDVYGHGTHIAGVIAAQAFNRRGTVGVSQRAKILVVRFLNEGGRGSQVDAATGIRYAVDMGAKVINCSWAYYRYNRVLADAIAYARSKGVIVVAGVGNLGADIPLYPAAFDGVVGVSAVDLNKERAGFSSWGRAVDFAAYGVDIYSPLHDGYNYLSGTSQASALMSGILAAAWSVEPQLVADTLLARMRTWTEDLFFEGVDVLSGAGLVDPKKMVAGLSLPSAPSDPLPTTSPDSIQVAATVFSVQDVYNFPNPIKTTHATYFGFRVSLGTGPLAISVYDLQGHRRRHIETSYVNGYNQIQWDARDDAGEVLANGVYLYVLKFEYNGRSYVHRSKLAVLN